MSMHVYDRKLLLSDSGCLQPDVRSWKAGPGSFCHSVLLWVAPLFWQRFCEQPARPSMCMSTASQIAVDCKSVHFVRRSVIWGLSDETSHCPCKRNDLMKGVTAIIKSETLFTETPGGGQGWLEIYSISLKVTHLHVWVLRGTDWFTVHNV